MSDQILNHMTSEINCMDNYTMSQLLHMGAKILLKNLILSLEFCLRRDSRTTAMQKSRH